MPCHVEVTVINYRQNMQYKAFVETFGDAFMSRTDHVRVLQQSATESSTFICM